MALRIEDPSSLPGREVVDQEGETVGEIKEVYGLGDDGDPMWVVIEVPTGGMGGEDKMKFVPLARLREDGEDLSVPYSKGHVERSPEVEVDDELSEEDENELLTYYSIGLADQEFRSEGRTYASQVPEGEGPARKVTDDLDSGDSGGGDSSDSGEKSESGESEDRDEPQGRGSDDGDGSDEDSASEESGRSEESESHESESEQSEEKESKAS